MASKTKRCKENRESNLAGRTHLRMKDLLFYVNPAHLLFPECVENVSQSLQFHLMMFQLLLEHAAIPRYVIVTRTQRRGIRPLQNGNIPLQFAQPFFHRHQLLTQFLQLGVEGPTVIGKWAAVRSALRRYLRSRLAALLGNVLLV